MSPLHLQPKQPSPAWWPYQEAIRGCGLFAALSDEELIESLAALNAALHERCSGQRLLQAGDPLSRVGLLLQGSLTVFREDMLGQVHIVTRLRSPDLFGEALYFAGVQDSPVSIEAEQDVVYLWLDFSCLATAKLEPSSGPAKLLNGLLRQLAGKNLRLSEKLSIMSKRSIRAKVTAVLMQIYLEQKKTPIVIPFDRQQLADYLAVDRSALSRQLMQMKKEGLIDYAKNEFHLLDVGRLHALL